MAKRVVKAKAAPRIRDRIKELRRVPANELLDNPKNWRKHPKEQQAALDAMLSEIGFAGAALAFETPEGLMLIDGHDRKRSTRNETIPVLVTDLTPEEADIVLATFDPIGAMAEADKSQLESLMQDIATDEQDVADLLTRIAEENGVVPDDGEVVLKQLDTKPPPVMTWVLIGIPTVRFGEVAEQVEGMAAIDGIVVETTSNDG